MQAETNERWTEYGKDWITRGRSRVAWRINREPSEHTFFHELPLTPDHPSPFPFIHRYIVDAGFGSGTILR